MPNTSSTHTAFLGLGSNLGDRLAMLRAAVAALSDHPRIMVEQRTRVESSPAGAALTSIREPARTNIELERFRLLPSEPRTSVRADSPALRRVRESKDNYMKSESAIKARSPDLIGTSGSGGVDGLSSLYETGPVGGSDTAESYLNAVVRVETDRTPRELLDILLDIERSLGRVRRERWGPRLIDIDLLLYASVVSSDAALTVPHPRLHKRRFVLEPLAEIAPQVVHPVLDATIADLAQRARTELADQAVTLLAGPEWADAGGA